MATNQRPDTPLAATPQPMPVSSGQAVAPQPISKYQATADAAIQQINGLRQPNAEQGSQPQQVNQQQ